MFEVLGKKENKNGWENRRNFYNLSWRLDLERLNLFLSDLISGKTPTSMFYPA
jgi:hypothetical protein